MPTPIYTVDAFTAHPFRGNPAAVCILDKRRDDAWMQSVAAEMNLSETAFLIHKGPNRFDLRWMTPTTEVKLCGHATIASSHILFSEGLADPAKPIAFSTLSGSLSASRLPDNSIELNFPAQPPTEIAVPPEALIRAIERNFKYVGKNDTDYLVEVSSERTLRHIRPNFKMLQSIDMRGLIVTCKATKGMPYDFVSRGFFPGAGILEDPVTGSAHCMLGPYWLPKLRKATMTGYQASKRGGYVKLQVDGDRVRLYGNAVTVLKGHLLI